jgi:hypothetical protein
MMFMRMIVVGVMLGVALLALSGSVPTGPVAAQSSQPVLEITGEAELVFDWTTDRCEQNDIPDMVARAFRDAEGQTHLVAAHHVAYFSVGEDLNSVEHRCRVVMNSNYNNDPSQYMGLQWIASPYTEDGETVYAVVHNEYEGPNFPNWYNALTLAVSTDGGDTFQPAATPPDHLIATLPYQFEAGAGPYGIFGPSNIIQGPGDYYYLMVRVDDYRSPDQWTCLLRTDDLSDPNSWRAWDGEGFNFAFVDPYEQDIQNPDDFKCTPISPNEIGSMNQSLTYNTYLDRYVLVDNSADTIDGRHVWGIFYAFSDDLINWTRRQLLWEVELTWTYEPGDEDPILYPSLLDPASDSRNYETTGQDAYLYYTQNHYRNNAQTLDRDLMRVPVRFYRSALAMENPEAVTDLTLAVEGDEAGGRLTDVDGQPIANAPIEVTARSTEAAARAYTISRTVPSGATEAVVGYRVNTECACSGVADMAFYGVEYVEEGEEMNRVPNGDLEDGLLDWAAWGSARYELTPGDEGMVRVQAQPGEDAALNSATFPVTAGAEYTITFSADIFPDTGDSGYFALMFLNASGEITRERIQLEPNVTVLGEVVTDADGQFTLSLDGAPAMPYVLEARYAGGEDYLPVLAEVRVGEG